MPTPSDVPAEQGGSAPGIPWPVDVGVAVGSVYGQAASVVQKAGVVPEWAQKAGTYLTDKGTLIRIGVFAVGGVMALIGVLVLLKEPAGKAVGAVAKVVK